MNPCSWYSPTLTVVFFSGFAVAFVAGFVMAARTRPKTLDERLDPAFGPGLAIWYGMLLNGAWMVPFWVYLGYYWVAC